ncbi:MAG: L,D-transpeptidase family protein [Actinomycetota bacterium]
MGAVKRMLTAAVVAAMLVAGCGGQDADEAAPEAPSTSSQTTSSTAAPSTDAPTTAEAPTTTTTRPSTTTTTAPPADPNDDPDREPDVDVADDSDVANAPAPAGLRPVASGETGDEVLALQTRLDELGFGPGNPDGSYGRRTVEAVKAFQRLEGIAPTGDANRVTIARLADYRYDGLVLRAGDEGADVTTLQRRLADGPFDPGEIDGVYGTGTVQAVWALEKLAGVPVDGDWGPLDEQAWQLLMDGEIGAPVERHDRRWVEVDLSEQVVKVYDPGDNTPILISHISSGSGVPWSNEDYSGSSVTPIGDFEINRRIAGWRESSLNIGRLYNPLYFRGGIAFHGSLSVPNYPASHGCIRLPMHVAEYLPDELPNGTPVHVDA